MCYVTMPFFWRNIRDFRLQTNVLCYDVILLEYTFGMAKTNFSVRKGILYIKIFKSELGRQLENPSMGELFLYLLEAGDGLLCTFLGLF